MKKKITILFMVLMSMSLAACAGSKTDTAVSTSNESSDTTETATESSDNTTKQERPTDYVSILEEQKTQRETSKNKLTEGLTNDELKAQIEAAVELGYLTENTIFDLMTDDNSFNTKDFTASIPEGFSKEVSTGICTNLQTEVENPDGMNSSISIGFNVIHQMEDVETGFTREYMQQRYNPENNNEEEPSVSSRLIDEEDKVIGKSIVYSTNDESKRILSIDYGIWEKTHPDKFIRVSINPWNTEEDLSTKYDEWVKTITIK